MNVLDKFLNVMKMNDEEFEDDEYLDDYEDFEEERPKKRFLSRNTDDDLDEQPLISSGVSESSYERSTTSVQPKQKAQPRQPRQSKIAPMRSRKGAGMEVCVIRPKNMEDASEITQTLLEDCTVILNMEGLELDIAQRIIDFASGSCYAIHGNLQKISHYIFIITPASVDISGDFQEMLNGAFDVPAFGNRF